MCWRSICSKRQVVVLQIWTLRFVLHRNNPCVQRNNPCVQSNTPRVQSNNPCVQSNNPCVQSSTKWHTRWVRISTKTTLKGITGPRTTVWDLLLGNTNSNPHA